GLYSVYVNIELPVVDCVVDMTIHGLIVDEERLARIEATEAFETEIRLRQVQEIAGSLDPASDKAVRDFLYEQCGLAPPFRTPGNEKPACKLALQRLADKHEVVRPIQNYRAHRNVLEAARTLRPHVGADGAVRGELDPLGARTSRFTCKEPNLLCLDKRLRETVCAGTGRALVEADYSLAEFRVLAHFSRDRALLADLAAGVDLHSRTASIVLGKSEAEITAPERSRGKTINFGILYGETEHGLSRDLDVSLEAARGYIDEFIHAHPGVRDWIESVKSRARGTGWVSTLFGHRRCLPNIRSADSFLRQEAERQAVNTVIQGSAGDLLKAALIQLRRGLRPDWRLLLAVHDSVLLSVPEQDAAEAAEVVRAAMEHPRPGFTVPLRVDVGWGDSWAACKPG
ncbi:MAG: DNA polymerase, partial [Planctomycetales bacterium]